MDRQRTELVERETLIRVMLEHILDPIELGVAFGIVGLLPRLGPLERHLLAFKDLTQTLTTNPDHPDRIRREILDELADTPPGERLTQLLRSGRGRRDDERDIVITDQAGT